MTQNVEVSSSGAPTKRQFTMPILHETTVGRANEVTIVLLTYNSVSKLGSYFDLVLQGVLSQDYPNLKLLVVDNSSKDDTVKHVRAKIQNFELLQLDSNLGWGEGNNRGALSSRQSPFLFFMNDDVVLEKDSITMLASFLFKNDQIAAVQPLIKNEDGSINCGANISFTGLPEPINPHLGQESFEVFYASGAAMLVRTRCFFEVGMFDEDLFLWRDDVDLCWRLRLAGNKIACLASAEARHYVSASLGEHNPILSYYFTRNNMWILAKLCEIKYLLPKLSIFLAESCVAIVGALLCGKKDLAVNTINGVFDGLSGLGKMILKRRNILKNITESELNNITRKERDMGAFFSCVK